LPRTGNGKYLSEIMHRSVRELRVRYTPMPLDGLRKCRHGRHNSHWTGRIGCSISPAPHPAPPAVRGPNSAAIIVLGRLSLRDREGRTMIWRVLLCLTLVLATALPTAAEQRKRPHGLFSTPTPRKFVPRPPRSIPHAAPARSQESSAASSPASRPDFPPAQTLEGAPARSQASSAAGGASAPDFPPAQALD
jgi:hypothetical protein